MKNFRTYNLAKEVYLKVKHIDLPSHEKDQLSRASLSIALNLAEGYGRMTSKDKKRFFSIAFASLRECQAIMELSEIKEQELNLQFNQLGAMIYQLMKKMKFYRIGI